MPQKIVLLFSLCLFSYTDSLLSDEYAYDLAIGGHICLADSLGRHPILFMDMLKNDLSMKFISTRSTTEKLDLNDLAFDIVSIIQRPIQGKARVSILVDPITYLGFPCYRCMEYSALNIAYTMFETTELISGWATVLNAFDAVVVPDIWLVEVYKNSGVKIPIFVLPLPVYLEDFHKLSEVQRPHQPFTFGFSGHFFERKNHMRLLNSFAQAFGNSSEVKLILHGRNGDPNLIQALENRMRELKLTNVEILIGPFSQKEYAHFFSALDCYTFISRGEGFSVTPREALAARIPCILSDNTTHHTICSTGCVRAVPSKIPVKAYGGGCGYFFDCKEEDAAQALLDVYNNYSYYQKQTQSAADWVRQYSLEALRPYYLSLLKPQKVILGNTNEIRSDCLITNSPTLYKKYCDVFSLYH